MFQRMMKKLNSCLQRPWDLFGTTQGRTKQKVNLVSSHPWGCMGHRYMDRGWSQTMEENRRNWINECRVSAMEDLEGHIPPPSYHLLFSLLWDSLSSYFSSWYFCSKGIDDKHPAWVRIWNLINYRKLQTLEKGYCKSSLMKMEKSCCCVIDMKFLPKLIC